MQRGVLAKTKVSHLTPFSIRQVCIHKNALRQTFFPPSPLSISIHCSPRLVAPPTSRSFFLKPLSSLQHYPPPWQMPSGQSNRSDSASPWACCLPFYCLIASFPSSNSSRRTRCPSCQVPNQAQLVFSPLGNNTEPFTLFVCVCVLTHLFLTLSTAVSLRIEGILPDCTFVEAQ